MIVRAGVTMRKLFFIAILLFYAAAWAQSEPNWNGYVQVRYTDDFQNIHAFEIRRAKLWMYRQTSFYRSFYYKVQGKFSFKNHGDFVLQDVFAEYRFKNGWIRAGQQKPDFSKERIQSDYLIPMPERSLVVNALIPAAESGARDIGLQIHAYSDNKFWSGSLGWFNGSGGNQNKNADSHFLLSTRQRFQVKLPEKMKLKLGISASFRKVRKASFSKIFAADSLFSGKDIRYGLEAVLGGKSWTLQGEYIAAQLENRRAWGWYLLGSYFISEHHLLGIQTEYFSDLIPWTINGQAYDLSYSWLIIGQQAKMIADLRMMRTNTGNDYSVTIQYQLFFN